MKIMDAKRIYELPVATSDGKFLARYTEAGLCGLEFPSAANRRTTGGRQIPPRVRRWNAVTAKALGVALAGRAAKKLPPLDLSSGTEFQQQVWQTLRQIACGRTRSYGEVARAIRRPKALRAVGGACGANPIPVLVPCHRVLAASQRLGGFSGGLAWKRRLLAREGVSVSQGACPERRQ